LREERRVEFPRTYTDENGTEWFCETFADYLFASSKDVFGVDAEEYEYVSPLEKVAREGGLEE
jgi:hypothetical protein